MEERGANLSVGERQLIAFARILAFDPDVLILDEATANIDSESEHIIQEATREVTKNRTSIIIAHRLSTIEQCDRIVVLNQGQIAELGTHAELIAKQGMYYQLAYLGSKSTLIDASAAGTAVP
ncbi:putative multidrug resistance ABC transporter ATP-binding/permease protein YheH [compost metagenome]